MKGMAIAVLSSRMRHKTEAALAGGFCRCRLAPYGLISVGIAGFLGFVPSYISVKRMYGGKGWAVVPKKCFPFNEVSRSKVYYCNTILYPESRLQ